MSIRTEPARIEVRPEELEQYRQELTGYRYRMLGSIFDADDAVQETLLRAWRGLDDFEGRSAARSWLYRIATNVCLDMLRSRQRRARPMDLGPSSTAETPIGPLLPEHAWLQPIPDSRVLPGDGPGRARGAAGLRPAGVRCPPAAPAPAAGGADPARSAPLAGRRGSRPARHQRGLGQQCAGAQPGLPWPPGT